MGIALVLTDISEQKSLQLAMMESQERRKLSLAQARSMKKRREWNDRSTALAS